MNMAEKNRLDGKKILIVDDEADVLETLEDLLMDCRTETAGSFEEAKQKLETGNFDMTILDIMGVDGYKLLEIATRKKITAVMLTARALSPDYVAKSYKEGAAFYVPKEEMINITTFLNDILEAQEKGKNTWNRWFDRFGVYCERHFEPDWQKDDKIFWDKFPFY